MIRSCTQSPLVGSSHGVLIISPFGNRSTSEAMPAATNSPLPWMIRVLGGKRSSPGIGGSSVNMATLRYFAPGMQLAGLLDADFIKVN